MPNDFQDLPSEPTTAMIVARDSALAQFSKMEPIGKNLNTINTDPERARLIEELYDAENKLQPK